MSNPKHAPRIPFALLLTGLIVGGMCALLALNTASAANELNRHQVATKDAAVAALVQQLQNQVAASAAPAALGSAAAELGMIPAGNPAFLRIGADGKVTVLGSAGPALVVRKAARHEKKPTATKTAKATSTAKSTGNAAASSTGAASATKTAPVATPTRPNPTTTPTPTATIGGGPR